MHPKARESYTVEPTASVIVDGIDRDDMGRFGRLDIDNSSGNLDFEENFAKILVQIYELGKRKQASYGPFNIAKFGVLGCLVRISDKFERLMRLVWGNKDNPLQDETVEDTWIDLANYALYAVMLMRGWWPGQEDG